ncbi:MAG: Na(+)-translocating NADH-quinone reductase subunit A [Bacteroidales bacterium]|nr:Na(+)-translocating NADH-quinone reductase subunit A [Bacteroidales bacterium]
MSEQIRLTKGLDIPISGAASQTIAKTVLADVIAIKPTNFRALVPKLVVKEGDLVLAGDPLFVDKNHPQVCFCSPCSGSVEAIVRGDKRKLLEVRVKADSEVKYRKAKPLSLSSASKEQIASFLMQMGLWPMIMQRPYGIIANAEDAPKSIFISAMNTAPLAADLDFALKGRFIDVQAGVDTLAKLTEGGVHFSMNYFTSPSSEFRKLRSVIFHDFEGKHPAGNVGIQINHISPINKGEVVWTVDLLSVATIGKAVREGIYDASRLVAVTGPAAVNPSYVKAYQGSPISAFSDFFTKKENLRFISGNVLTGEKVGLDGYMDFFDDQISILNEGDYYETFGWCKPFRCKKFSFSHSYWSWLIGNGKKYKMDTNVNGGARAFVVSDVYSKVLPMDIYPVHLLKACIAGDLEKMENLGIYEVLPEDFALCEFVDPSKNNIQQIISDGIDLMLKEMA